MKREASIALTVSALMAAHAPGTLTISMPLSAASFVRTSPGSDIIGVPASVTMAMLSPESRRRRSSSALALELCS